MCKCIQTSTAGQLTLTVLFASNFSLSRHKNTVNQSKESCESFIQKSLPTIAAGCPYRTVKHEICVRCATLYCCLKNCQKPFPGSLSGFPGKAEERTVCHLLQFASCEISLANQYLRELIRTLFETLQKFKVLYLIATKVFLTAFYAGFENSMRNDCLLSACYRK